MTITGIVASQRRVRSVAPLRVGGVELGQDRGHPATLEVHVQAMERQGSRVEMVADALEMLSEVQTVRRTSRGSRA
jgi:hypothetical protein